MSSSTIHGTVHQIINTNRRQLLKKFQLNGLTVRQDALTILENELKHGQPQYKSVDDFISTLMSIILRHIDCDVYIVDAEISQKAVDVLRETRRLESSSIESHIVIRSVVDSDQNIQNSSQINQKTSEINFKYQYQQLVKHLKKLPAFLSGQFNLMTIGDLNTYAESGIEMKCVVFAMIRRDFSRIMQYLLEDPTGKIPVTFGPQIIWHEWATLQNGIYLIEGIYEGQYDSFVITSIGLPPPIRSILPEFTESEKSYPEEKDQKTLQRDPMVILLADIHLDQPPIMEALNFFFTGYNSLQEIPEIFVLIGDFCSKPVNKFDFKDYIKNFVKLISTFKRLSQNSTFIFVPGPNDPTDSNSELFVKNQFTSDHFPTTTNRLKSYHLPSNPFHLQIGDRNICLFANKLMNKYLKNTVNSREQLQALLSKNNSRVLCEFFKALGRLIITDAHLTTGLNRNYSSCLTLFPQVPDLMLLVDPEFSQELHFECQPFEQISSARLTTLRSFSKNRFQFLVYYSRSNHLEESQIST